MIKNLLELLSEDIQKYFVVRNRADYQAIASGQGERAYNKVLFTGTEGQAINFIRNNRQKYPDIELCYVLKTDMGIKYSLSSFVL